MPDSISVLKDILRAFRTARSLEARSEISGLMDAAKCDARNPQPGVDRVKSLIEGFDPQTSEAKAVAASIRSILGISQPKAPVVEKQEPEEQEDEERTEKSSRDRLYRKGRDRAE